MSEHAAENDEWRRAPPPGWVSLGSLIDHDGPVECSEKVARDGLPLWERSLQTDKSQHLGTDTPDPKKTPELTCIPQSTMRRFV